FALAACFLGQQACAEDTHWHICNETPEKLDVAVAFDPGNGQLVSKGYWNLKGCGGCANIGKFAVKGVWYRASTPEGVVRIEGNDRFCVHVTSRFQLGQPDTQGKCSVSASPNSKLVARGFRAVRLETAKFTTHIVGEVNGRKCID